MKHRSKKIQPSSRSSSEESHYAAHDGEWRKIGLSGPARRALVDARLYRVSDLRKITLEELASMHGMGKSSIARIKVIMEAKRIEFRKG
jgi:hypothetical protein